MSQKQNQKCGAALLDKYFGNPSWRKKCEGMKIENPWDCVLVRLFGGYTEGLDHLGINGPNRLDVLHGFDIDMTDHYSYNVAAKELQAYWEDEFANPPLGTDD